MPGLEPVAEVESGARAAVSRAWEPFLETRERGCPREKTEVLVVVVVGGGRHLRNLEQLDGSFSIFQITTLAILVFLITRVRSEV